MNTGNFVSGVLVGAALGIATGLLIAPSSGNQTRRNIARRSRVYSQQAIDAVRQYLDTLKQGKGRNIENSISAEELLNRYETGAI